MKHIERDFPFFVDDFHPFRETSCKSESNQMRPKQVFIKINFTVGTIPVSAALLMCIGSSKIPPFPKAAIPHASHGTL